MAIVVMYDEATGLVDRIGLSAHTPRFVTTDADGHTTPLPGVLINPDLSGLGIPTHSDEVDHEIARQFRVEGGRLRKLSGPEQNARDASPRAYRSLRLKPEEEFDTVLMLKAVLNTVPPGQQTAIRQEYRRLAMQEGR